MTRWLILPVSIAAASFIIGTLFIVSTTSTPVHEISLVSLATTTPTKAVVATPTATSTAPVAKKTAPKKAPAQTLVAKKTVATTPTHPPVTQSELEASSNLLRSALVNILCTSSNKKIPSVSGSGVVIDPKGYIVTNAHVALHFLLAKADPAHVTCTIRAGSPAKSVYKAEIAYISPLWVNANINILSSNSRSGTGELDFAVLAITGSATDASLPSQFAFVPLSTTEAYAAEGIVTGSYGAQFLSTSQIQTNLFPTIVYGSIKQLFTFAETSVDLFSLGGSAVAQEGSSGGGVVDAAGTLAGVLTTSTVEGDTSTRNVSALSASYIKREFSIEAGQTLETLLSVSPTSAANAFTNQVNTLGNAVLKTILP